MTYLERLHHDENTLHKVYDSLLKYKVSPNSVREIVSDMQNRGLLFRERPPGEGEPDTSSNPILSYFGRGSQIESSECLAVIDAYLSLALDIAEKLPDGPEKSVSLRKLLESRDAALRVCS